MRKALQRLQTAAADRWSFIEHPRLYRRPVRRRRDLVGPAFKWMIFLAAMWWVWAPIALAAAIIAITVLG